MALKTPQENLWNGSFGNEYTDRNQIEPADRVPFFKEVLRRTFGVRTILEIGANRGHNLQALRHISPNFETVGIDVNERAVATLNGIPGVTGVVASAQSFESTQQFDLVLTCGVLIHIAPEELPIVYKKLFDLSRRYVLINEYFSRTPVEVQYRGHSSSLFKRDFAKEILDTNPEARVVDYGFLWERENPTWDDMTWFLLEKSPAQE